MVATISVEATAATTARNVTVTNTDAGSGSLTNGFTVNAKPTVTAASPASRGQGASSQTIKITGTGFVNAAGLAASFSASGITVNSTAFVSSTEVTANISIASGASTGAGTVTVTNPDAGVGSKESAFTVNAGPVVTSVAPSVGDVGGTETVSVKGSSFVTGAVLSFGNGITVSSTSVVNSGEITAKVAIEAGAGTGARTVTVTNTDAGTGSLANAYTVNGAPTVESTNPSSRGQGSSKQAITIKGTNFVSGAGLAASFSGAGITVESTSFVSATEVTATISVTTGATTGLRSVTVTNGDTTSATAPNAFTVNTGMTITSPTEAKPVEVPHNGEASVPIAGTGFVNGLTASLSNSGEFALVGGVTFTNSTSVSIKVKSTGGNGKKTSFTLTNPDGGSATCTNCVHD
ncbi:MAG: IPT/TIG domain-containing protein [Solirubrobacterales bacterium]